MKFDKPVLITIVICIAVMESIALLKGINGVLLTSVIGLLAYIAGLATKGEVK